MPNAPTVRDNPGHPAGPQYEIYVGDALAGRMTYLRTSTTFTAIHTEVDDAYAGQGLASILVRTVLDEVRSAGLRLRPSCPFVAAYLRKHPEYADLVAAGAAKES